MRRKWDVVFASSKTQRGGGEKDLEVIARTCKEYSAEAKTSCYKTTATWPLLNSRGGARCDAVPGGEGFRSCVLLFHLPSPTTHHPLPHNPPYVFPLSITIQDQSPLKLSEPLPLNISNGKRQKPRCSLRWTSAERQAGTSFPRPKEYFQQLN